MGSIYNGSLEEGIRLMLGLAGSIHAPLDVIVIGALNAILSLVALAAVIGIIMSGVMMIVTGGGQLDRAKRTLTWTIVGLIVVLLAKVIVFTVYGALGVTPSEVPIALPSDDIRVIALNALSYVLGLLGTAAVCAIITASVVLIVGLGTDESRDKAKRIIFWTLIGLLVVLLAKVIVSLPIVLLTS